LGIIDRLFGRNTQKKSVLMGQPRFTVIGGKVVPVGDDLESNITEGYESIGTIYSIIKIMTNKAGSIPGYEYVTTPTTQKQLTRYKSYSPQTEVNKRLLIKKMQEVDDSPFLKLIKNPNGYQTQSEFIKQVLGYRYITGNCYIRKNCGQQPGTDPGNSKPVELTILPAQYIDIIGDSTSPYSVVGYKLNGGGSQVTFHPNEIIHFKYPNYSYDGMTLEHLYGMSPLKAATYDITAAKYMKIAQASQAQNEGAKGMMVRNDDYELTEEQRDAIQQRIDSEIGGAKNRARVIATNANVRWEQIGLSATEMDLVKTFQLGKEDLANIYNIPIHLISSVTSTFNNVEAAVKYLTTNTVWPDMCDLQDMLNKELLQKYWGENRLYMYDISDMPEIASDINTMAASLKDIWWISPNEKRFVMKWDDSDDPNMDEIIVPSGYIPLERVFEDPFAADMNQAPPDYNNGAEGK
jgi:HK97 family phage portal protein